MSDFKHIQALLEKYWEGETTLEEERQLKGYFASDSVDAQLQQYASMFQAIREEQTVQLNKPKVIPLRPQQYQWQQGWAVAASIILLLAAGAWWLFSSPGEAPIVAEKSPMEQPKESPETAMPIEKQVLAQADQPVAKRVVKLKRESAKREKTPVINPEEEAAMQEIKAALALVSSKIRKGREEAAKGAEHLESIDKIFKRKDG